MVELKLAAIKALDYEEFFSMFGEGKIPNFRLLLDSRLSPYLSSAAYQFWRRNADAFETSFYKHGYSGWALRIAGWLLRATGRMGDARAMCSAQTIEEQDRIWKSSLRRLFVDGSVVQRLVDSPIFLWNALGVCASDCSTSLQISLTLDRFHKIRRPHSRARELFLISSGLLG